MSDGGTPRIYPLEIYVRRGEVVLAVVGTVLFGLLMLGVAVFNWTDERGFSPPRWRVRAALVLRRLRGGSEPSASVPSARPGGGDIPLVLRVGGVVDAAEAVESRDDRALVGSPKNLDRPDPVAVQLGMDRVLRSSRHPRRGSATKAKG
jgi:hypothetical protein